MRFISAVNVTVKEITTHSTVMEHTANPDELDVMSGVDFIVPLKQVGIITRSVLEAIQRFYRPRRIIVVTKKIEVDILKKLTPYWDVGSVEYMDEAVFFVRNFGLSFEDIIAEYDASRPGPKNFDNAFCIPLHYSTPIAEFIL